MKKAVFCALLGFSFLGQGCAPTSYVVQKPKVSEYSYKDTGTDTLSALKLNDVRSEAQEKFSYGILKADLKLSSGPLDEVAFLKEQTEKELEQRGIKVVPETKDPIEVDIKQFKMVNHRSNGWAPFITMTHLSAVVKTPGGDQRIGVFVKRGKVPVWAFDEIVEPTLNQPLSIVVKEFAAKLNQILYGKSISDADVKTLVDSVNVSIKDNPGQAYLDVYQLGFGNNLSAVSSLVEFTKSADEYVRLAAISALGILKAESELETLKSLYASAELWQDRAMALKAIGDLGSQEAISFLKEANAELNEKDNAKEYKWSKEILSLYLD